MLAGSHRQKDDFFSLHLATDRVIISRRPERWCVVHVIARLTVFVRFNSHNSLYRSFSSSNPAIPSFSIPENGCIGQLCLLTERAHRPDFANDIVNSLHVLSLFGVRLAWCDLPWYLSVIPDPQSTGSGTLEPLQTFNSLDSVVYSRSRLSLIVHSYWRPFRLVIIPIICFKLFVHCHMFGCYESGRL